jgi:hypothetical protein
MTRTLYYKVFDRASALSFNRASQCLSNDYSRHHGARNVKQQEAGGHSAP